MPSNKFIIGFSMLILILISSCSIVENLLPSLPNNSPIPPTVFQTAAIPPPALNTAEMPSSTVSPTVSQPLIETYFGIPYDAVVWTLIESGQEHVPPSLGYVSDPYCSMAVNASDTNLSIFTMVDKEIVLGKRTWTRRYFLDNHNNNIFEAYFTDEYPDEFYNQLTKGDYYSTGGFRLLGLYETCRQATQGLLAGML